MVIITRVRPLSQPSIISVSPTNNPRAITPESPDCQDALAALIGLGFRKGDSVEALDTAIQDSPQTAEELLRSALKNLDNNR